MATVYGLTRHFYVYNSDDGNPYVVALTDDDAVPGGFGTAVAPDSGNPYPRGWKMRYWLGKDPITFITTKIPVFRNDDPIWVSHSSFVKHAVTFNGGGKIGERRFNKN